MAKKKSDIFDFESALAELEGVVEKMEQGEQTLEQSLQDFERGIELTRNCQKALDAAQQKVEILMEKSDQAPLHPFEDES